MGRRQRLLILCGSLFHAINDYCLERSLAMFQTESKFQEFAVERVSHDLFHVPRIARTRRFAGKPSLPAGTG